MKDKKPRPTVQERIAKYLEAIPGAIEGASGSPQTFRVACTLYNGWALSEDETLAWLKVYNAKCEPRWSEKELKHKAKDAAKATHGQPRGHLLGGQRSEPDWTLPTKPVASGQVPTTLTTAIGPHSPVHAASLTKNSKVYAIRVSQENNVVNVVKSSETPLVNPETGENALKDSALTGQPAAEPGAPGAPPSAAESTEAHRIARELAKLHRLGAISGPADPEALFYANFIRTFEATFTGKRPPEKPAP